MQGGRGAVSFTKAAAEAAWQGLLLSGVAHAADPHLEDRSRDLAYAGGDTRKCRWGKGAKGSKPQGCFQWRGCWLGRGKDNVRDAVAASAGRVAAKVNPQALIRLGGRA